ncbi:hypothetical protein [Paraburkholderia tropica]|uniref:hypothetical protein n=1 Tax=Paraburkholderia tropica TaxID=92647 RepID=UPI003D2831D4
MKKNLAHLTALATATLLAACSSSNDANEENFAKAISAKAEKSGALCFGGYVPGGITLADDNNDDVAREQRALAKAGLLTARATTDGQRKPQHAFDLSDKGRAAMHNGEFCFGKIALDKVVKWDDVKKVDGMDASTTFVYYTYKIVDVPDWATTADLQASEPTMRAAFAGANDHTVMRASITRMADHWSLDNFGNPVSGVGI